MGRSLSFQYINVPVLKNMRGVTNRTIDILTNLKEGDQFMFKKLNEYIEWCPAFNEYIVPLTRAPSNYGMDEIPIAEGIRYKVLSADDEPALKEIKGFRTIRFMPTETHGKNYYLTYRIGTDGTVRECEGLGILSVICNIVKYNSYSKSE